MDDRADRDTETTDQQIAQTVAAVFLAYDRLIRNNNEQDRANFVRFASLRLATVLRRISFQVDALMTALLTRSRRQYVSVIPSTYDNATQRLETAFSTIVDDQPLPEVEQPLEAVSEVVDETPADNSQHQDEKDTNDGQQRIAELQRQAADQDRQDRDQRRRDTAEEQRQSKIDREQRRQRDRERSRQIREQQQQDDRDARAAAKREIADLIANLPAEQHVPEDFGQDEPTSAEDQAIMDEYRKTLERAAERQRARIERLIQTEIKVRSREAFHEALGKRNMSSVWITRPNACPICIALDGTVIGPGEKVPTSHPGCGCRIRPLLVIDDPYVSTGAAA